MSQYGGRGPTSSNYPYGRLNSQVYPVHGGMEDWAYAASWDTTPGHTPANSAVPPSGLHLALPLSSRGAPRVRARGGGVHPE